MYIWVQSPPSLCTTVEWRGQVFILFLVFQGVPGSQTLPALPLEPPSTLPSVFQCVVHVCPFPGLCFIKKMSGPLRVCGAVLESPAWSLRTSDKEAVMCISRGNTVLLFCFTVLFICPQPANKVSSGNSVPFFFPWSLH